VRVCLGRAPARTHSRENTRTVKWRRVPVFVEGRGVRCEFRTRADRHATSSACCGLGARAHRRNGDLA
jgi:hypothetical protein